MQFVQLSKKRSTRNKNLPQLWEIRILKFVRLHLLEFPQLDVEERVQADQQEQEDYDKHWHWLVLHFGNHFRTRRWIVGNNRRRRHPWQGRWLCLDQPTDGGIEQLDDRLLNCCSWSIQSIPVDRTQRSQEIRKSQAATGTHKLTEK